MPIVSPGTEEVLIEVRVQHCAGIVQSVTCRAPIPPQLTAQVLTQALASVIAQIPTPGQGQILPAAAAVPSGKYGGMN